MEGAVDGSICLRNVEGLCNGEGSATMRKVELTSNSSDICLAPR